MVSEHPTAEYAEDVVEQTAHRLNTQRKQAADDGMDHHLRVCSRQYRTDKALVLELQSRVPVHRRKIEAETGSTLRDFDEGAWIARDDFQWESAEHSFDNPGLVQHSCDLAIGLFEVDLLLSQSIVDQRNTTNATRDKMKFESMLLHALAIVALSRPTCLQLCIPSQGSNYRNTDLADEMLVRQLLFAEVEVSDMPNGFERDRNFDVSRKELAQHLLCIEVFVSFVDFVGNNSKFMFVNKRAHIFRQAFVSAFGRCSVTELRIHDNCSQRPACGRVLVARNYDGALPSLSQNERFHKFVQLVAHLVRNLNPVRTLHIVELRLVNVHGVARRCCCSIGATGSHSSTMSKKR